MSGEYYHRGGRGGKYSDPDHDRSRSSQESSRGRHGYLNTGGYEFYTGNKEDKNMNGQINNNTITNNNKQKNGDKSEDSRDDTVSRLSTGSQESCGKKRKSFRRLIVRFAEKTSMVGVPYINNAKFWWAKLIWSVCLLVAIAVMTLHLWYLIDQYFHYPIQTKVSLGFSSLDFPQVTICNINHMKMGALYNYQGAEEIKELVELMKPENLVPDQYDSNYDPYATKPPEMLPPEGGTQPPTGNGGGTQPPDGNGGTTKSPIGNGGVTQPPGGNGGTTKPPAGNGDGTQPPGGNGGTTKPPAGNGGGTQPPGGNGGTTKPPAGNGGGTQPPGGNGGTTKPPAGNGGGTQPPGGNGGTTKPPAGNGGGTQPPGGNGGTTKPPAGNGGGTQPPGGNGGTTKPPAGNGGGTQPPGGNGGTTKPPIGNGGGTQPPGGNGDNVQPPKRKRRFVENYDNFNISKLRPEDRGDKRDLEGNGDVYDGDKDAQTEILDLFNELYMDIPKRNRSELGHRIKDMLISCTFNGRECNDKMFKLHQTSEYGNCWTMSSDKFRVLRAGPSTGLTLILYLETTEYLKGITNGYGARLQVHEKGTYPFPADDGIYIPASMETAIGLKQVTVTRKGDPYGTCDDGTEFQRIYASKYTRRACQMFCEASKIITRCECFDDHAEGITRNPNDTSRPCRTRTEIQCMLSVYREGLGAEFCACDNPCSQVSYSRSVSQRQWPSDDYAMVLLEDICENHKEVCKDLRKDMDMGDIRNNFLKLTIYFEDLNFEEITEDAEIEVQQFLSDVGGAIGLWIGLSILSLCEVIQLFIELCDYGVHKTIKDSRRERRKRKKERKKRLAEERQTNSGSWTRTDFGKESEGYPNSLQTTSDSRQFQHSHRDLPYGSRY